MNHGRGIGRKEKTAPCPGIGAFFRVVHCNRNYTPFCPDHRSRCQARPRYCTPKLYLYLPLSSSPQWFPPSGAQHDHERSLRPDALHRSVCLERATRPLCGSVIDGGPGLRGEDWRRRVRMGMGRSTCSKGRKTQNPITTASLGRGRLIL